MALMGTTSWSNASICVTGNRNRNLGIDDSFPPSWDVFLLALNRVGASSVQYNPARRYPTGMNRIQLPEENHRSEFGLSRSAWTIRRPSTTGSIFWRVVPWGELEVS